MATITITTPGGAEDTTALANVGEFLGLGRPATLAEARAELIRYARYMNTAGAASLSDRAARASASFNLS